MDKKILKSLLLILGISSALVCIGISIYMYKNPLAANGQFLTQIPFVLIITTLVSSIAFNRLRKNDSKIHLK
ncbi:hypothetical protein ACRC6Q_01275 [Planococcus sp. SE5232]|uniref:hypothetical protein n=1 Tax=unclassified Planococcus (in: firmicutes) TaxID=2662419 RepID=UPI001CBE7CD0|nr:hypothetical protein [Planococcus sp. 4-30]